MTFPNDNVPTPVPGANVALAEIVVGLESVPEPWRAAPDRIDAPLGDARMPSITSVPDCTTVLPEWASTPPAPENRNVPPPAFVSPPEPLVA